MFTQEVIVYMSLAGFGCFVLGWIINEITQPPSVSLDDLTQMAATILNECARKDQTGVERTDESTGQTETGPEDRR